MAFPTVAATNNSSSAVNATTHTVNLPTGIAAGNLLLVFFSNDGSATASVTTPASGWTELFTQPVLSDTARLTVFYRFADGAEASTITVTTSASEQASHASYRITGAHASEVPASSSTRPAGSNANPDPPSLNPASWGTEDTLWIASCAWDGTPTGSAYPSGYSGSQITVDPSASGGAGLMVAAKNNAADTEDPGSFTMSANEQWASATIAVRPAAAAAAQLATVEFYNGSAWVDISADCITGTLRWSGGIRGGGPTDRVAVPGSLSVEMDNSTGNSAATLGYYSPDHASKRTGWALGAKIRVRLSSGGNDRYWMYRIKEIKPVAGQYRSRRVEVVATDYLEEFSKRKVSGLDIETDQTGEALLASLVATLPFAPSATDYDTGSFSMPYAFHEERDEETYNMTVLQKISQSDLSYIYVDGDASSGETLHYENHAARMASLSSSGTLSNTMAELELRQSIDNIWNKVRVNTFPVERETEISVLGSVPEEFSLEPSETRTIYIPYRDSTSERRMSGILARDPATDAIIITADTDYKMSSIPGDGGNDLNGNLTVTPTAGANSILVQLSNSAAVKGFVNLLQVRGYPVKTFERIESVSSDSTSITTYGEKTITYSMPYQSSSAVGKAFADELVRRHKDPGAHIDSVSFIANRSTTLTGYALTFGIGTRITITETVTGINADFFINGYEYELLEGNILQVTWNLEKNYNTTVYWLLGDSTYGVLDSTTTLAPL
jgi:hypothetical protein